MTPSSRSSRAALVALGIAALAAAAAAVPRDSGAAASVVPRRFAAAGGVRRTEPSPVATSDASREVLPLRDPFANDPSSIVRTLDVARTIPPIAAPPEMHVGAELARGPAAPNAPNAWHVSATVTGARPFAIVADGNGSRIVTVGDAFAGKIIAAIDASGVRLTDGTRLSLAPTRGTPATEGFDR